MMMMMMRKTTTEDVSFLCMILFTSWRLCLKFFYLLSIASVFLFFFLFIPIFSRYKITNIGIDNFCKVKRVQNPNLSGKNLFVFANFFFDNVFANLTTHMMGHVYLFKTKRGSEWIDF